MPKATITLDLADVRYEIEALQEELPVKGNAMSSDDEDADRACENAIIADLEGGNLWAWCCVRVRAVLGPFVGSDTLGCVSCASEADFVEGGCADYYADMKDNALADLRQQIEAAGGVITE